MSLGSGSPTLRIRYLSYLARVAGVAGEELPIPESRRLGDALDVIGRTHPGILGQATEYQWRHGSTHIMVAVNGRIVEEEEYAETQVAEGDEIALMGALGGGTKTR